MAKTARSKSKPAKPTGEAKPERCQLCGRDKPLTRHHLIPRAVHGKPRYRRRHGKPEMQRRALYLCRLCHNGIHDLFPDEKLLADAYNTLEALLADERLQKHVAWVRKQK